MGLLSSVGSVINGISNASSYLGLGDGKSTGSTGTPNQQSNKHNNLTIFTDKILTTAWTRSNDFFIEFHPVDAEFSKLIKWDTETSKTMQVAIADINLPDLTSTTAKSYYAGKHNFAVTRPEQAVPSFTMRDYGGGLLYNYFLFVFNKCRINYPVRCRFRFALYVRSHDSINHNNTTISDSGYRKILDINDMIIEKITPPSFKYENDTKLVTFNVNFVCGLFTNPDEIDASEIQGVYKNKQKEEVQNFNASDLGSTSNTSISKEVNKLLEEAAGKRSDDESNNSKTISQLESDLEDLKTKTIKDRQNKLVDSIMN